MSRSTYIYTVQDPDLNVIAAFTVKHELTRWLWAQREGPSLFVHRIRDGRHPGEPVWFSLKELREL